jgi:branched-chain amino acid transport system permease protein
MGYIAAITVLAGINLIAVLGLAILTGYSGLFSIGHAGFMALGGYVAAILAKELHLPVLPALLGGGLFTGLASFVIGYPAFRSRLRGDYFAIATLGFAEAVRLILSNLKTLGRIKVGGAFGYMDIPRLSDLHERWLPTGGAAELIVVGLVAAAALGVAQMYVTSQHGKNAIAVGQDEVAAQMMGVDLMRTKMFTLFISAGLTGVAGGLMAFYFGYISPSFFTIARSSDLLAAVVFGGMQSLAGPMVTAVVLVAVPELFRSFADYRLILYGLLFVVVMIFRPQGLMGYAELDFGFLRRLVRRGPAAPEGL